MEIFTFCLEIIRREGERFNVGVNTTTASQITAATAENINYDIAHNRCSYLYRCGAINLSFAKDCFSKFFSEYKSIVFLLSKWINSPNLTVCSLSKGPALDYIALLLSYQECEMFPSIFRNIKVISKYGAWRNTVNIMHQIVTEGYFKRLATPLSIGNIEVIQGDPFMDFSQKVKDPIFNSDVVIMMKTLNLQADGFNKEKITKSVQEFLAALKPDAILFCIDTKPSVALITREISAFLGTYLLQPTFMSTSITLEHTDFYKDVLGCFPVVSARGSFFVWQKSSVTPTSNLGSIINGVSESVKQLLRINNDISYCDKPPENNSDSEKLCAGGSQPSIPTYFAKNCNRLFMSNENLKSVAIESENNDQLSIDCTNIPAQNSKKISSSSLQNGFLTSEYVEEHVLTKETSLNYTSVNKSIQTESENNFKIPASIKIAALTERIANMTETLNVLLQTNELKNECTDENCLKHMEGTCKYSASSGCILGHCSSVASCFHKYHHASSENFTCNCSEEKMFENYCSNHIMHKQGCLACNQHSSSISLNSDHETTRYCNIPCHKVKFSTEKKSVPKLVIPLNNLSSDVVTQIISLLSESNQEL